MRQRLIPIRPSSFGSLCFVPSSVKQQHGDEEKFFKEWLGDLYFPSFGVGTHDRLRYIVSKPAQVLAHNLLNHDALTTWGSQCVMILPSNCSLSKSTVTYQNTIMSNSTWSSNELRNGSNNKEMIILKIKQSSTYTVMAKIASTLI